MPKTVIFILVTTWSFWRIVVTWGMGKLWSSFQIQVIQVFHLHLLGSILLRLLFLNFVLFLLDAKELMVIIENNGVFIAQDWRFLLLIARNHTSFLNVLDWLISGVADPSLAQRYLLDAYCFVRF